MQKMKKVSVVIPNYNGKKYLKTCLEALKEQSRPADRIILVDNGSNDGSADYMRQHYPEVQLVTLETNTGFCGAVNIGIKKSEDMDYIILLNNDTKVEPDFIREMVLGMERHRRAFSGQAKMLQMANPNALDGAGDLYCAFGWAFARGKGRPEQEFSTECEIFASCAGAAIYRRKVLDKIGGFDENHFAYLEDTDIGWRARLHGYHNYYFPRARVLHVGSAASGSVYNLFKVKNTSRNSIYLIRKNMPTAQIILNLPLLIPGFLAKAVFFTLKGFGGEYIRGIRRGFEMSQRAGREGKIVRFTPKMLPILFRIQIELWVNCVRRFANE